MSRKYTHKVQLVIACPGCSDGLVQVYVFSKRVKFEVLTAQERWDQADEVVERCEECGYVTKRK